MTSIHFITQGCSANQADSEFMKGLLKEAKFTLAETLEEADVVVLNSCTVKGPTESAFFRQLEEIRKEHPYKVIILAGCLVQADPKNPAFKSYCLIGTKQIHSIVSVVEEALHNNVVQALETGEMPPLNLPKVRKNPVVEIIPISRGCLSACTFCKTKQARGNLESYPVADIVQLAHKGLREGVQEIWLTSQDTFCYGFDIGTNLVALLKELVQLPGQFKIRVGMGSPVHFLKLQEELIPFFNHEKLFSFVHLPAQSGSDKVLNDMQRGNTHEEFVRLIAEIKERVPSITFSTDIIVGYPTETDDDYWQTLELVRKTTPDVINLSHFWARPKTPAAKLTALPGDVVSHRARVLADLARNMAILRNERWQGWEGSIVIDEKGQEEGQWIGRNPAYKPVIVEGSFKLGDWLQVRIVKTTTVDLRGELLR